ncbi:MAG: hypothetical protein V3S41_05580 [Spirochaetia bacterium]
MSALIILSVGFAVFAQAEVNQQVTTFVDWKSGALLVTVRRVLPATGPNLPAAVSEVRTAIERDSVAIIVEQLRTLPYDSLRTVNELLLEEPHLVGSLVQAASGARMTDARPTPDLRQVEVNFRLDLYGGLLAALIRHDRPVSLNGILGWTATTEYTGIVIYAADELTVHGTGNTARLQPALLPGIYYYTEAGDGVERLMEGGYVDPRHVVQWGPVLYSDDILDSELSARIGTHPLRIIAYGAFGRYPTDVVISYHDAVQVLANENNRSLIAEGRVAIIIGSDQL